MAGIDAQEVVTVGVPPPVVDDLLGLLAGSRPAWHADALCREHPAVNFFPERGAATGPALEVCSRCLVIEECRSWALGQGGPLYGVWGGLTQLGRMRLRTAAA